MTTDALNDRKIETSFHRLGETVDKFAADLLHLSDTMDRLTVALLHHFEVYQIAVAEELREQRSWEQRSQDR